MNEMERRARIAQLVQQDGSCQKIQKEQIAAEKEFSKIVGDMPQEIQEKLWKFPGMWYYLYHRVLGLISEKMRFEDE